MTVFTLWHQAWARDVLVQGRIIRLRLRWSPTFGFSFCAITLARCGSSVALSGCWELVLFLPLAERSDWESESGSELGWEKGSQKLGATS